MYLNHRSGCLDYSSRYQYSPTRYLKSFLVAWIFFLIIWICNQQLWWANSVRPLERCCLDVETICLVSYSTISVSAHPYSCLDFQSKCLDSVSCCLDKLSVCLHWLLGYSDILLRCLNLPRLSASVSRRSISLCRPFAYLSTCVCLSALIFCQGAYVIWLALSTVCLRA